ncbi:hypothetical protein [Streptacidiphilus rugosus]|uniref:hypothetical protein n=1 Tax=Streptacidiphilus rugosus TaxID=405783 RepID=UPI0012FB6C15|nr:hypothetical protein [Streptacidiphilus rugosus]
MRLGKIVATGIAEDVVDASVEESLPTVTSETTAADPAVDAPAPAQAGSSAER